MSFFLYFRFFFFFFNETATTEIYSLSLHDALPICNISSGRIRNEGATGSVSTVSHSTAGLTDRSEEHTSELQSRGHLVCRLLLEKKKQTNKHFPSIP